jgi:hypothetical protein
MNHDTVHKPLHYAVGGIEAIDVIKAKLTPEEFRGYLKGCALKYLMRGNYKNDHDTDMGKCAAYSGMLVSFLAEQQKEKEHAPTIQVLADPPF